MRSAPAARAAQRRPRGPRGTRRSPRWRPTTARPRCCSGTRLTTRRRRCCSGLPAGRARGRWQACRRAAASSAGRCSALRRPVTAEACAALGLDPWQDPHNADRRFARVRVRLDALPALEAALGPGVAEALARTAGQLRADAEVLEEISAERTDGDSPLSASSLAELPGAVRTRVLRSAALAAGCPAGALTAGARGAPRGACHRLARPALGRPAGRRPRVAPGRPAVFRELKGAGLWTPGTWGHR